MKNIKNCALIALLWAATSVRLGFAATGIDVVDKVGSPGATVEVAITLEATEEAVAGIQFDLSFDGSQLSSQPAIVGSAQSGDVATRSRETQVGRRRVLVYSTTASPLSEGQVVRIPFTINDDTPFDDYALTLIESAAILAKQDATAFDAPTLSNGMITVQDAPATVQISGTVRYYGGDNDPIKSVELIVAGDVNQTVNANDSGAYSVELDAAGDYTLAPFRLGQDIISDGLDLNDVIDILLHSLNKNPLDSGSSVLAADVDRNKDINLNDVIDVLLVSLDKRDFFTGTSEDPDPVFRFYSADLTFTDDTAPWDDLTDDLFSEPLALDAVIADVTGADFVGVKMGDVNGSWDPAEGGDPGIQSRIASAGPADATITIGSGFVSGGEEISVPLNLISDERVIGLQFTARWDPDFLEFVGIDEINLPGLSETNLNMSEIDSGVLRVLWIDPSLNGVGSASGTNMMNLVFNQTDPESGAVGSEIRIVAGPTALQVRALEKTLTAAQSSGVVISSENISDNVLTSLGSLPAALIDDSVFRVWTPSESGSIYRLETTEDLGSGQWTVLDTVTGTGGVIALEHEIGGDSVRFYRVQESSSDVQ